MAWATGECQRDHELHLTDQVPISHFEEAFLPEVQKLAENIPVGFHLFDENDEPSHIPVFDPFDDPADMPAFDGVVNSEMVLDVDDPGFTLSKDAASMLSDGTCSDKSDASTSLDTDFKARARSKSDPTLSPEEVSIKQGRIDSYVREANTAISRLKPYCHYVRHSQDIAKLWETTFDDIRQFVSELQEERNERPGLVDTRVLEDWVRGLQEFELTLAAKIKAGTLAQLGEMDDSVIDGRCFECARWCDVPRP